ncbi:MAG: chromosome partitioning protein [Candidatus Azotimanducaceae bacterium]|jgi:chromosome partitioning protein
MRIWTVANQKGGVGKTTTSISLADALSRQQQRVLLLDLDPQGSLTSYLKLDPDKVENTAYEIFDNSAGTWNRLAPSPTGFDGVDVIGASIGLANLEKRAATLKGRGLVVKSFLQEKARDYDYVVIDTPPALGLLMVNSLVACERLVVPVQTDFLALKGLERMLKVLEMLNRSGTAVDYLLVPTMYDQRTNASKRCLSFMQNRYPERLWAGYIPVDTKFREASRLGVLPSSLFAQSHGVKAYDKLVATLTEDVAVVDDG